MRQYNLTDAEQDLLRWLVAETRAKRIPEEFWLFWSAEDDNAYLHWPGLEGFQGYEGITRSKLDALVAGQLIRCHIEYSVSHSTFGKSTRENRFEQSRRISITGEGYIAVDTNFAAPDKSFVTHLTPLADVTNLDGELKSRCLPILGAGSADPKLWDSAVRTAGVILEERLRAVGQIKDASVGRDLVNKIFAKGGTLSSEFSQDGEREGYRDLFAGVVGTFRNPSAHKLVDPNPAEGGAFIVFVNLLLKHLARFDKPKLATSDDFLATCSPITGAFFRKILQEAKRRHLRIKFGTKGFTVRKAGQGCFFYCYPPGAIGRRDAVIEIYLKEVVVGDSKKNTEMRVDFLEIPGTEGTGDYTIRLKIDDNSIADADEIWTRALKYMQ
jgi:hypothetical protein